MALRRVTPGRRAAARAARPGAALVRRAHRGRAAGAAAAGAVPVVAVVGVYVALGSGYYLSRQLVKSESTASGFSQGFVMGLLGREWRHAVDRFSRKAVLRVDVWDEANNKIRVDAYNSGLAAGFLAGRAAPDARSGRTSASSGSCPGPGPGRGPRPTRSPT